MTAETAHVLQAYEQAYFKANHRGCKVVDEGSGWYSVETAGGVVSWRKYRKSELVDMTARLEHRNNGTEPS